MRVTLRSGACRLNEELYGVALVTWRGESSQEKINTEKVLAHEIGHLVGMTHDGNHNEEIENWYALAGIRCIDPDCGDPPTKPHGTWNCDTENLNCTMKCDAGFATSFSAIKCINGQWSKDVNNVACSPSVFLIAGGVEAETSVEIYHPTISPVTCTNIELLELRDVWFRHYTFVYKDQVYTCGGNNIDTKGKCRVLNMQGTPYSIPDRESHSAVVMQNRVFLIGGFVRVRDILTRSLTPDDYAVSISLSLPMREDRDLKFIPNLSYIGKDQCLVSLDPQNFIITGGEHDGDYKNNVTKYNILEENQTPMAPLEIGISEHGCLMTTEAGNRKWIVITGGFNGSEVLRTTMRLLVSGNVVGQSWEQMGQLNEARRGHAMAVTKVGIIVIGGMGRSSVEYLNWTSKQWTLELPSLASERHYFGAAVEIPASILDCQLGIETVCQDPPVKANGTWICNNDNTECKMECIPGFTSFLTTTTCSGGVWKHINNIQCSPSVFLLISGISGEIYHPKLNSFMCFAPSIQLSGNKIWENHATILHSGRIYLCGGSRWTTYSICKSRGIQHEGEAWITHFIPGRWEGHSTVVLGNRLYFIGGNTRINYGIWNYYLKRKAEYITLPLIQQQDYSDFSTVTNLNYKGTYQCVLKIDDERFIIIGGHNNWHLSTVTMYNQADQTNTSLASLRTPREKHGCILMEEGGEKYAVVTGGKGSGNRVLQTSERLQLTGSANQWEEYRPLSVKRYGHSMIMSENILLAVGGKDQYGQDVRTVDALKLTEQSWSLEETSLQEARSFYGGAIEVPAYIYGCEFRPTDIRGCEGEYDYDKAFSGGTVVSLPSRQTCHNVCLGRQDCQAWTWNWETQQCRIHTSLTDKVSITGSVSGQQNVCKPKCYSVDQDPDRRATSLDSDIEVCEENGGNCIDIVHQEPSEFASDDIIYACHATPPKCERIDDFNNVAAICSAEPIIVVNSINRKRGTTVFTTSNIVTLG